MNLRPDLFTDGIRQDIFEQFPLLVAEQPFLHFRILPQFFQQFLEPDRNPPVLSRNINSPHGNTGRLPSPFSSNMGCRVS